MNRRGAAVLLAALVAVPLAACSDDGPGEGEARLEVQGAATVERADGDRETVDGGTDLSPGDRVTVTEGVAVMRLHGGTTFELREGVGDAAPTTVLMADRPVLEAGDLLVSTPDVAELEADGTQVDVASGAARVSRAFGMSVSAYDADVRLDSAGVEAPVPALRRMAVPDLGRPPAEPRPVTYDDTDPWDRRYLGAAIALGSQLESLGDDLTGLLPEGSGRTVGFYRSILPGLEDEEGLADKLPEAPTDAGETLIGAAITDLGERGTFEDRWDAVFGFRDDGADWGIVALDQAVRSEPLVGAVEEAFNASFDDVAQGEDEPAVDDGGDGAPADPTDGGTGGAVDGGADGGGTDGSPPTTQPPAPPTTTPPITPPVAPPPPDTPDALDPVVEPVDDVVDLVNDLLGGLLP